MRRSRPLPQSRHLERVKTRLPVEGADARDRRCNRFPRVKTHNWSNRRGKSRLPGSDLRNVATLLFAGDTGPLTQKRNVWTFVSATQSVLHDAKRQPAQTCAPEEIGAVAALAVAPISDLHEDTPRCAVSACHRGPAERAARARRHGDAPRFARVRLRWPPLGEHAAVDS